MFVKDRELNDKLQRAYGEAAFLAREREKFVERIARLDEEEKTALRRQSTARTLVKGLRIMVKEEKETAQGPRQVWKVPDELYQACFDQKAWSELPGAPGPEVQAAVAELRRANADVSRIRSTRNDRKVTLAMIPEDPGRLATAALAVLGRPADEQQPVFEALLGILDNAYLRRGPKNGARKPAD
jgi:hypothetical protein